MDRISTATAYNNVLANLMAAQSAQTKATNQISSQENATDLQGYGNQAETLIAMQSVQAQTTTYLNQSQITAAKLSSQDLGLTQLNTSASDAVTAITNAIGTASGATLMQSLESAFQGAVSGLNTTYNGQYIFSGGQVNSPATSATNLTALAAAPSVAGLFNNDQMIATYNAGPNGPFTNPLSAAQTTFLQSQIATFKQANTDLTTAQAQNGIVQSQVTDAQTTLTSQQTTLTGLIGNITDTNMAQATANLQQAQLALQASSRAFVALQSNSLLAILTASGH